MCACRMDQEGLCSLANEVLAIRRMIEIGQAAERLTALEPILRQLEQLAGAIPDRQLRAAVARLARFHQQQADELDSAVDAWRQAARSGGARCA